MSKKETDQRGFGIYLDIPAEKSSKGAILVKESSLAFEGAHARIYQDHPAWVMSNETYECIHFNVTEAKQIVEALKNWIAEAEAGLLTEPAEQGEDI